MTSEQVDWGYQPHNGPDKWANLSPEYACCALGKEQSPIDLTAGKAAKLQPVDYDYTQTKLTIENTGGTIQLNPEPGHGITVDGKKFELQQFHFHHRSEHLIEGRSLPLELHLVHKDIDGSLAVIGAFLEDGEAHRMLETIWDFMPAERCDPRPVPGSFDLSSLLPNDRRTWRYRGSLTTPPCTEGVNWIVLSGRLSVSTNQIDRFASIFPNNSRPVQPLGDRELLFG